MLELTSSLPHHQNVNVSLKYTWGQMTDDKIAVAFRETYSAPRSACREQSLSPGVNLNQVSSCASQEISSVRAYVA